MHSGRPAGPRRQAAGVPAILWNDARGRAECAELARAVPDLVMLTGVQPMPGFTAAKLLWLRHHEPDVLPKSTRILLAKDYVRLHLTGEVAGDMSDAAGTQLFRRGGPALGSGRARRRRGRCGSQAASRSSKGPRSGGPASFGRRCTARPPGGIHPGRRGGGGDAGTGALGVGCIDAGQGFISLGTAAVFVVAADRYAPKPETMLHNFAHAIPGRWYQMAGMLNGADALPSSDVPWSARPTSDAMLRRVEDGYHHSPSRLVFLPYLAGERTPHNNPDARGVLLGLDPATDTADIVQAVLEGVAFSLADAQDWRSAPPVTDVAAIAARRRRRAEPLPGACGRR